MDNQEQIIEPTNEVPCKQVVKRKPRKAMLKKAKRNRAKFAKAYLRTMGNTTLAMKIVKPHIKAVSAYKEGYDMIKRPDVRTAIEKLLEKEGMPKDYFIKRMKDLAEVVDKNGNPIASVQWDVVKTGLEFHGLVSKKQNSDKPQIQVNYNIDADRLGGVLNKLSEVTRKLDLSNINKGAEDADIITETGSIAIEDNTQGEEHGSDAVQP